MPAITQSGMPHISPGSTPHRRAAQSYAIACPPAFVLLPSSMARSWRPTRSPSERTRLQSLSPSNQRREAGRHTRLAYIAASGDGIDKSDKRHRAVDFKKLFAEIPERQIGRKVQRSDRESKQAIPACIENRNEPPRKRLNGVAPPTASRKPPAGSAPNISTRSCCVPLVQDTSDGHRCPMTRRVTPEDRVARRSGGGRR